MFSRCYCVKLNPLRYQQVFLFFPLLYFISRISMIRQASTEQLDSLPILQQSVITENSKFSSQTRSTKTIMIIISSMRWKKNPQSTHIFIPFIIQFYFGFFGEAGRTFIFRAFPPSFRGYGRKSMLFGLSVSWYFQWTTENQIRHQQTPLYIMKHYT